MTDTCVISRLEHWTDEQWDEVVTAAQDTVAAVAEEFDRTNE